MYPTSSKKKVDWSRVEAEADKEEEEGEAAIEKLFQKIYKDNPDDVKRAMMKSFVSFFYIPSKLNSQLGHYLTDKLNISYCTPTIYNQN